MTGAIAAGRCCLGLVLLLAIGTPAHAQAVASRFDTTFSLRGDAWSGSRQLDNAAGIAQASLWGRTRIDLDLAGTMIADGWLREQTHATPPPHSPRGRVREFYWRYAQSAAELKLGRQMVVWGRADGINPTDNLSPRDFTLLTPEDGDQRYGNEAVQLRLDTRIGNLIGLWFPHAASHTLPLLRLQNVSYTVEQPPRNSQWAVKWDASGEGIDGSVSYFHGIDPMPDLAFNGLASGGVNVAVRNHPVSIFGADLSLTRGAFVWRAEAAVTRSDSGGAQDFAHKKPQVWLVAGGEYGFDSGTTLGMQATILHVQDFLQPDNVNDPLQRTIARRQAATSNQTSANQQGLTWRLARRWRNDTLLTETSGVAVWPSHSGIWRTRIDYAIDDHTHVQAGTDYYFGPENSFFGQLGKNRLVYVQLRYGW